MVPHGGGLRQAGANLGAEFPDSMPIDATWEPRDVTFFTVTTEIQGVYWRAKTFDRFDGRRWHVSAGESVDVFPRPWLRWGWGACNQMRPYLERRRSHRASTPNPAHRASLMGWLRGLGQNTITAHLEHVCRNQHHDLYHEPNYIPLASDLPTVATVHDLSILLHPDWHPADRVKHFEKNFHKALAQCVHFLAISETGRAVREYRLTPAGRKQLDLERANYRRVTTAIDTVLDTA